METGTPMTYRFPNTPKMKDISLEVEVRNQKIWFSISGPRSFYYAPLIWYYFRWHSGLGPIATRNGANVYSLYIPPIPSEAHNRQLEVFLDIWLFKKRIPYAVTISVTNKCQLNCLHCSLPQSTAKKQPLSLPEVKRIVAECIDLGVTNITFTGGEPLLEPGLEECLAAVPADKAVAQVFSNAVGLDPERVASLKKAGASCIHISLDSPDAEEHDRWRGRKGLFEMVERGVKNALREGLLVGLSTYATNESIASKKLSRVSALAAEWGVHEVSVFDVIPTGRLLRRPDVMITKANRRMLLREARLLNGQNRGRPRIVTQSWTNSGKGFTRFLGCLAAIYQFHITAFGDFMPCDFTPLSFGNIRTDSVRDLWQRLVQHPAYCRRSHNCRMQDPGFRKTYIDSIPQDADLPCNINGG